MNCPICNIQLLMSEKQGIEIDYCPKCRGLWLDRGELDKIIQRSAPKSVQGHDRKAENFRSGKCHDHDHDCGYGQKHGKGYYKKRKFLSDLFDF